MRSAAVLSIIRDGETIRKVPVEGEAMLGRGEGCLIRLDDRAISRQHALFKAVGDGVSVEKKSEYAPLSVNGEECTRAVLKEGDVIALGPYLVKLSITRAREESPAARSSDAPADNSAPSRPSQASASRPAAVTNPLNDQDATKPLNNAMASPPPHGAGAPPPAGAVVAYLDAGMPDPTMPIPATSGQNAQAALAAFNEATNGDSPLGPTNPPPVGNLDFAQEQGSGAEPLASALIVTGNTGEIDLGQAGGLELVAANAGEGTPSNGLALPGAPMDGPGFQINEGSMGASGGTGAVDPNAETRLVPAADLRARLVLKKGKAPKAEYELRKAEISIGRGKDCDIVLDDKKVSRKNTVIAISDNRYVIRDLGSANGTYLNGKAVTEEPLFGEDIIRVGNEEFEFHALSDSYAKRQKDFMAVTQGSIAMPDGSQGPDISIPPPIEGGESSMGSMEPGNTAELDVPSDLRSPSDGRPVLYSVSPTNMIPMGTPPDANGLPPASAPGVPGIGDPHANPLGIPGLTGLPGANAQPKGILAKINALPPRRRLLAFGMILAILYLGLFDDDEAPHVKGNKPKAPSAAVTPAPGSAAGPTFEGLSPDKKQFIEAQHQLAFDHYRNQEYEKALHEVQKIFDILPDYKDSREIERYAKEGLRKQQAEQEELKRKQDEAARKQQIEQLLGQIKDRMAKRDYATARELFARVIELDPENQLIAQWKKEIEDWEEQLRIKQQEKDVQDQINQRAWDIFKEGQALKKRGKYHAAIATFARVPDVGATDRRVLVSARTMIATCKAIIKARRDPVLKDARAAEANGEFKKALDLYVKSTVIDPPYPEGWTGAARVKAIIHDRAKGLYTEAVLAESYSDFEAARKKLQEILNNTPTDEDYHGRAQRKLEKYQGLRGLAGGGDQEGAPSQ